jgi:hypothetical protein
LIDDGTSLFPTTSVRAVSRVAAVSATRRGDVVSLLLFF